MDQRGAALTISMLAEMANLLLKSRGETPAQRIGKDWPKNYLNRHYELASRFSRKYDYRPVLMKDPKIIVEWFRLFQNTIIKYDILSDDIYNFDESGFAMGISATTKITCYSVSLHWSERCFTTWKP